MKYTYFIVYISTQNVVMLDQTNLPDVDKYLQTTFGPNWRDSITLYVGQPINN